MKLRAITVDDEDLARQILREYLEKTGDVEIVAECANGFEAVKAVGEHRPDLLFLDIQMPKLDGFEVLELIDPPVAVIFVTAYDQYALKAFDAAAVDYLLKPFSSERLGKAVERARALLSEPHPRALQAAELAAAARPAGQALERVVQETDAKAEARSEAPSAFVAPVTRVRWKPTPIAVPLGSVREPHLDSRATRSNTPRMRAASNSGGGGAPCAGGAAAALFTRGELNSSS